MSETTGDATKPRMRAAGLVGRPATLTDLFRALDCRVPARPRAIFDRAVGCLAGIEILPALGTCAGATGGAQSSDGGTGAELLTTPHARLIRAAIGKLARIPQSGMLLPELLFRQAVAGRAQGYKVTQHVRGLVVSEQVKRYFVMHREPVTRQAATLASVMIAFAGGAALAFPVGAAILTMAAQPRGAVSAAPFLRCAPRRKAGATAKVMRGHGARLAFDGRAAGMARHGHAGSPDARSMYLLPRSVARETTEGAFGHGRMIRLTRDNRATLSTANINHNSL